MAEITDDGYQSIKDFLNSSVSIPNEWDYLALYDDSESEQLRVSITDDSRTEWQDVDGDAILEVYGEFTGDDSDISLPTTFEYSAIFDDDEGEGGDRMTEIEQFATATLDQDGDSLEVTHTIEVPQQS